MANPTNRQELIDWCMRKLGQNVIEINVDPDQVEDRIDEAFLMFQQFHMDAVEKVWLRHQLTAQDIANEYITIPPPVIAITRVLPIGSSNQSMGMFDIQYQLRLNDLYTFTSTSIVHYDIMRKHLALLEFEFNVDPGIQFTRHQQQLGINWDWKNSVAVGSNIIIECYRILDPATWPDVYNDKWLKDYCTCLIKLQWSSNLQKYAGVQLIGGSQLNGTELYQQALAEKDKLEEVLQSSYVLPIDFILG
jgi:hypothetical protein